MKPIARGQRGFTLIELIVVIAILGVLSAITVPMVTNYLKNAKERAYNADKDRIQSAVDAYYSAPGNTRYTGKRQYPVIGRAQTNQSTLDNITISTVLIDQGDPFTAQDPDGAGALPSMELWNPVGGTQGADLAAVWSDGDTDGIRTIDDASSDTWDSVSVTHGGVTYHTDPRYFFIDFEQLVTDGYLDAIPASAAADNAREGSTATYTGSYIWYVDDDGRVQSLHYYLPSTSGFVSGVHP